MRTNFDRSRLSRSLFGAVVALAALTASPPVAVGQSIIQQRGADPMGDFQKFLPPVASIPWLEARSAASKKSSSPLPEAGSFAAWLLTPRAAASWDDDPMREALARASVARL